MVIGHYHLPAFPTLPGHSNPPKPSKMEETPFLTLLWVLVHQLDLTGTPVPTHYPVSGCD